MFSRADIELILELEILELQLALIKLANVTGKRLGEVVKQNSRLIAWNLAHNTQPYGMELASKKQGEAAVLWDVGMVYASAQKIYKQLEDEGDINLAKAWYKLVKMGGYGEAEKLLRTSKLRDRNAPIFAPLDRDFHKAARTGRGRVNRHRAAQIVPDAKSIRAYGKEKAKLVGFGKAGWITAGSKLGNIRLVPAWITRHRGAAPGGCDDQSHRPNDPYVTLTNEVRYASKILPDHAAADALRMQREKMTKHINEVITHTAQQTGFIASP